MSATPFYVIAAVAVVSQTVVVRLMTEEQKIYLIWRVLLMCFIATVEECCMLIADIGLTHRPLNKRVIRAATFIILYLALF